MHMEDRSNGHVMARIKWRCVISVQLTAGKTRARRQGMGTSCGL